MRWILSLGVLVGLGLMAGGCGDPSPSSATAPFSRGQDLEQLRVQNAVLSKRLEELRARDETLSNRLGEASQTLERQDRQIATLTQANQEAQAYKAQAEHLQEALGQLNDRIQHLNALISTLSRSGLAPEPETAPASAPAAPATAPTQPAN
jgi:chromosome segregation ATPase